MEQLISKLRKAHLITHLVEIDENTLEEKKAAAIVLDVLNAQVFRVGPYLYGVDLSGLDCQHDKDRIDAVTEALCQHLGTNAVTVTKLAADAIEGSEEASDFEHNALLLMRTLSHAAQGVVTDQDLASCALLNAEFAVRTAELTAKGVANLEVTSASGDGDVANSLQETTEALKALTARIEHIEARIGALAALYEQTIQDQAVAALVPPLKELESKIVPRLDALEQGQLPPEWFLNQIMSRIGDLDEQLSDSERETRVAALAWAKRLDDQLSSVAGQLIPPEWFLSRIMSRIGELDQQLSGSDQEIRAVAERWASTLDTQLRTLADQTIPPEWLLGKLLTRIDALEERLLAETTRATDGGEDQTPEVWDAQPVVTAIETQLAELAQRQDRADVQLEASMQLVHRALAELLARQN